jgi:2-polyprenyl-3-methyl-5-hydroxy-6-metoxy-1,4-benzoquinol methylase
MIGTVLANWFQDQYQPKLIELVNANADKLEVYSTTCPDWQKIQGLSGLTYRQGKAILDGGCGVESILRIIEACGFEVQRSHNKKGHTTGFYVQSV